MLSAKDSFEEKEESLTFLKASHLLDLNVGHTESQRRNELVAVLVRSEHVFWAQRLGVVDEDF